MLFSFHYDFEQEHSHVYPGECLFSHNKLSTQVCGPICFHVSKGFTSDFSNHVSDTALKSVCLCVCVLNAGKYLKWVKNYTVGVASPFTSLG